MLKCLYSVYAKSKPFTRSPVTDFKVKEYDNLEFNISQITGSNTDLDTLEEKFCTADGS